MMTNTTVCSIKLSTICVSFLVLPFYVGCQRPDGPELATVSGIVTLDGEPLEAATVHFQPKSGRPSYGRTGENGQYVMGYSLERSGVTLGEHFVSIRTPLEDEHGQVVR